MSDFYQNHDGFYFANAMVGCDFECFFSCHLFFTIVRAFNVPQWRCY